MAVLVLCQTNLQINATMRSGRFLPRRSICWRTGTADVRPPECSACLCVAAKVTRQNAFNQTSSVDRTSQSIKHAGSHPRQLSEVCVHVLIADWNHLSDAFAVTEDGHTHTGVRPTERVKMKTSPLCSFTHSSTIFL